MRINTWGQDRNMVGPELDNVEAEEVGLWSECVFPPLPSQFMC